MKNSKGAILGIILLYLPDILFVAFIYYLFYYLGIFSDKSLNYTVIGIISIILLRSVIFFFISKYFYFNRLSLIKDIILGFKKGRFLTQVKGITGNDGFAKILKELVFVGKFLDNIVSTQRDEIDIFHDFYDSIVFSPNSYFLVLSVDEKIEYANEGFCKKIKFEPDDIVGKKIEEIFYFVNARLKGAIIKVKTHGKTVILEQTHLLSRNRVPLVFDIKVSKISVKGKNKIMIVVDDITSKLRKDYQITLISQLSGYLQRDEKIEKLLFTILTAITSGHGLGFNRAMLFLIDNDGEFLEGKMAVGPDSMEEAVEIWNSINNTEDQQDINPQDTDKGQELLKKVLQNKYLLEKNNLFLRSIKSREVIHIFDSWNDDRVEEEIKVFMDVNEFIVVPLYTVNDNIGIIIVDNKFNQVPIGNDTIELLKVFAIQSALTIESQRNLILVKKEMEKIEKRQEAIVDSEKMAAVGKIATHIAHEIRNPLVTMGGYARRITTMPKDGIKNIKNIEKFAKIILNESERLEKTLSNVMDFTKPSSFIKEFNNINDIINDTINLLKNLFLERRIEIIVKLDDEMPLLKSDFNQMKQVMINLLQNSIEVTPAGGMVEIITEFDSKNITIKVKDTGFGIDEKDPKVVFEPFFTKKISGVGLGLANVKKIINDHNGIITVRNREFGGVEFKIQLPLPA